jgi:hypothetical protein
MDGGFPRLYRNICREKVKYQLARFGENYRNIEKLPDLPVAALTAQPLAALPPYGCGVPLAGNERPAGWQYLRHKFIGAMPSSLSLRGGRRPTWQSRSTRPDHRKAIGENAAAFPRLHPKGFLALRAQGATAPSGPRNDKVGGFPHSSFFSLQDSFISVPLPCNTRLTALQNFPLSIFDFPRSPILFFSVFLYKYFRIESAKIRKKSTK